MSGYNIGVDLGTNSSGVSVVDNNFKLIKHKNKNLWSVIKFDSGETAATRRSYRGARRLLVRKRKRIHNLRMLIGDEVIKIDNTFFQRLEDSFKHKEDRVNKVDNYNLFIEKDFNDKDYFRKYPTIYHLRKELISDESKKDIRLVYLALHHILKYRGNFIYEGEDLQKSIGSYNDLLKELEGVISTYLEINLNLSIEDSTRIINDTYKNRKDKVIELIALEKHNSDDKKILKEIFNGIFGLTMDLSKVNSEVDFGDLNKIQMSDEAIDEKMELLSSIMEESIEILEIVQKIYTKIKLNDILNGEEYISDAMILRFNNFKEDLGLLKKVVKENCNKKDYYKLFKSNEEDIPSFNNYINNKIKLTGSKKGVSERRKTFYSKIKNLLKNVDTEEVKVILNKIENDSFLIKLNITSNSVIPYQVHLKELDMILRNQGEYYNCLKENRDKLISILTFRIPYYVGPLSKEKTEFSWITRNEGKENENIYPWNFKDVVNIDKSAEDFIRRMTSYCSYFPCEPVLPFNSILYTEYLYYNEINKIRFNDKVLDNIEKEKLKEEVFMTKNNVTEKDLINWYIKRNKCSSQNVSVSGFMGDGKVNVTLKPIRDFTKIYGKITNDNIEEIERIIYYLTVFEDKKIVESKLEKEFNLRAEKKKAIMQFKYTGWGRLSKKLLEGIKVSKSDCSKASILDELKRSNLNFMQIINDSTLGFNKKIDEINGSDKIEKINFDEHIKILQGSPALKKSIYQATKQIEEIIKIMGRYPENIFIEVAREDQESKRTLARNKKMLDLYDEINDKSSTDKEIIKNLKDTKFKIDNERLYLYLMQRGKCMYSGKTLDVGNLSQYEVDHIIPCSLIKDDSFCNKVLVIKEENQKKSSGALEERIINDRRGFWEDLLNNKLISKKKYDNLTNYSGSFNKNIEKGFINRQLVEVRQITKHVTNLFNRAYGDKGTTVYAIKAELVDNFKRQFNICKNRDINDFHHAKDAYATAVVGLYIKKRFNKLDSEFIYDEYKEYSKKATKKNKFGFIISSMVFDYLGKEEDIVWDSKSEIEKIKKIFSYNDPFVVKKTEIMSGQLFKLTRLKKPINGTNVEGKIPLKNNKNEYLSPEKYGYYEGVQEAYCSIIEFINKNKRAKRLVGVPIMYANKFKSSPKELEKYLEAIGYSDVKIIKERVPKYQKIVYEGHEFYLASSNEWQNAKQLKLSSYYYDLICELNNDNNMLLKIEAEKLEGIFYMLIEKIDKNYPYSNAVKKLSLNDEKFKSLDNEGKLKVINEMLKLTRADASCANLKVIGGTDREGRLNGKATIDINKVTFIYESFLGVNKREVKY